MLHHRTWINEKEKVSLLKEYKSLLDSGAITEDQYNKKRDELLK